MERSHVGVLQGLEAKVGRLTVLVKNDLLCEELHSIRRSGGPQGVKEEGSEEATGFLFKWWTSCSKTSQNKIACDKPGSWKTNLG